MPPAADRVERVTCNRGRKCTPVTVSPPRAGPTTTGDRKRDGSAARASTSSSNSPDRSGSKEKEARTRLFPGRRSRLESGPRTLNSSRL